jgi:hypothetical protein
MTRHFDADKERKPMEPRHRAFLRDYKMKGAGMSLESFYRMTGYKKVTIMRWRTAIQGFREEMDNISTALKNGPILEPAKKIFGAKAVEQARVGLLKEQLEPALVLFLEQYGSHFDRVTALEACALEPRDIELALAESPAFRIGYGQIQDKIRWSIEDKNTLKAMAGDNPSVALYLQNRHPDYQRKSKIDVNVTGSVTVSPATKQARLEHWRDKYGSLTAGSMPLLSAAQEIDDIVEGEFAETPS